MDRDDPSRRAGRHRRVAAGVFLGGLAVTALILSLLASTAAQRDRQGFQAAARAAEDAIRDRVETSIALLRGTAGLLAAHDEAVTAQSFQAYVARLALREQYPGLLGIGFSRRIDPAQREALEREVGAQRGGPFRVWPPGHGDEVHAIVYLEPLDERNRAAIGYDMGTNPTRRAAMARARDAGAATSSGIVELVQEIDELKQPGFLIYLPVYRGGGIPETVEERRRRLFGFAYSPIRAVDFLSSAFSHESVPTVNFAVYHGGAVKPGALLYEHTADAPGGERFTKTTTVEVAGEPWTFVFRSRTTLAQSLAVPVAVGLGGLALSLLLAFLVSRERSARADAEQANRMKDQFLATLSHELRTPLNAILGWTALLKRGGLRDEDARHGVAVVDRNARAQAKLIDDLLDMNRIVSGKLHLEMQTVDPAAVLADALASLAPEADAKGVRLVAAVPPGAHFVRGDPARLQQVAWNLLSNAIRFTPPGGRVRAALEAAGERVRLTVADTGEGIAPQALPRIFDRFAQADGTTTRRHGGLGLGLAIVRQLVELHGGSVRAHSAGPGQGATFTVELPRLPVAPAASAPVLGATRGPALAGVNVLVVDDEPDARELARIVLERHQASVRCAASAREALEAARALRPDVLVSDIGMPGMDGYELVRRLRANRRPGEKDIAAVAMTAYAREEDRAAARAAGFEGHLAKPVTPDELVAAVATAAKMA